jgi:hypothetical protein
MADLVAHVQQASHNERCANYLLATAPDARDWAITAAFYAAVHLLEACFTSVPVGHTESAPDRGDEDPHTYRSRKVRELAGSAYVSYKKLLNASYHVRYLPATAPGGSRFALEYYDISAARTLVQSSLAEVRAQLQQSFDLDLS